MQGVYHVRRKFKRGISLGYHGYYHSNHGINIHIHGHHPITLPCLLARGGKYYAEDLPSLATLQQELHLWHSRWKCVEKSDLPRTPSDSLAVTNKAMFPNIHTLLCTLQVTSCEYKRLVCYAALKWKEMTWL